MGPHHGAHKLRFLGVLSVALLLVLAVFYASSDLRNSLAGLVGSEVSVASTAEAAIRAAVTTPSKQAAQSKIITIVKDKNNQTLEILDEPLPDDCHGLPNTDYAGYAVQWGLGNKARSAAECCRKCKEYKPRDGDVGHPCHAWVWCGDPSGVCWTMDIHEHTTGDCWLKFQAGWDGNPDRSVSNIEVNHEGRFTPEFRAEHKTAPEFIPWVAGLIAPKQPKAP